jgi:hypothetical protein
MLSSNKLRTMWYVMETTLQHQREEEQRVGQSSRTNTTAHTSSTILTNPTTRGCVGIFYTLVRRQASDPADVISMWQGLRLTQAFPIRWAALHMCTADQKMSNTLATLASKAFESHSRTRFRVHIGTYCLLFFKWCC